jgi:hypothetical protein
VKSKKAEDYELRLKKKVVMVTAGHIGYITGDQYLRISSFEENIL